MFAGWWLLKRVVLDWRDKWYWIAVDEDGLVTEELINPRIASLSRWLRRSEIE